MTPSLPRLTSAPTARDGACPQAPVRLAPRNRLVPSTGRAGPRGQAGSEVRPYLPSSLVPAVPVAVATSAKDQTVRR